MHSIGAQLKVWRKTTGLQQEEAAAHLGLSPSTYQNYERGTRRPDTDGWEKFVRAGINANWLLTGEGPMLLADLLSQQHTSMPLSPAAPRINVDALEAILEGILIADPKATAAHIAGLAASIYQRVSDQGLITPEGLGPGHLSNAA